MENFFSVTGLLPPEKSLFRRQSGSGAAARRKTIPSYLVLILLALTSVVYAACFHISLYKLLESCKPESSLALLLIACVVPFAYPFVVLSCRKYDDGVNVKLCGADRMLLEAEKQEDFSEPQGE